MVKHITPYQKDQNKKYYNANSLDIKIRRAFKAYESREEMYTIIKGVISKEDAAKCISKAPQALANLQGPNRRWDPHGSRQFTNCLNKVPLLVDSKMTFKCFYGRVAKFMGISRPAIAMHHIIKHEPALTVFTYMYFILLILLFSPLPMHLFYLVDVSKLPSRCE